MGQECFCGCGRKIRGMTTRGMNKQGRRTVDMVEHCRVSARTCRENQDAYKGDIIRGLVEPLESAAQEGDAYADFWAGAVHGTDLPPPAEARAIKKEWVAWGKDTALMLRLADAPPEELQAAIDANRS